MQWDGAFLNAGFSTAAPEGTYLPLDADPERPTVAAQADDPGSLLSHMRRCWCGWRMVKRRAMVGETASCGW